MTSFDEIVLYLDGQGLTDIIFPFIIVFTIVFAILQKTKILGTNPNDETKPRKNLNLAVAFVFGAGIIIGVGPAFIRVMNNAFPQVSLLLMAIVAFFLLVGMHSTEGWIFAFKEKKITPWIFFGSLFAVIYIYLSSAGFIARPPDWLSWLFEPRIRNALLAIAAFALIIIFITSDNEPRKFDPEGSIGNRFRILGPPPS